MFATEYAPLGDLTSNVNDFGIGETNSKRVARQIGAALEWMHSKNLCHLDVKLDNILVFRSDFTKVKLCDFGSVKAQGDIVIKKNELLPYCPPELVAKHANEYYQVIFFRDFFFYQIISLFFRRWIKFKISFNSASWYSFAFLASYPGNVPTPPPTPTLQNSPPGVENGPPKSPRISNL